MQRITIGLIAAIVLATPVAIAAEVADVWDRVEHGFADSNGVKIHYASLGTGPLVVMIHGFPDFWYSWRHQMATLSGSYRVVAIDQRGYNLSDKPKGQENYDTTLLVDDVKAVIEHLGEQSATIVGHDWGGRVAWGVAMTYPEITDHLIICNLPHPRGVARERALNNEQKRNTAYAIRFQQADAHLGLSAEALARRYTDPVVRQRYVEAFELSDFEAMLNFYKQNYGMPPFLVDESPVVKVVPPVLIFHGLDDGALRHEALNHTWEWLASDMTLVTIPNVGHWVQDGAADYVSGTMKAWLELQRLPKPWLE